MPRIKGNCLDCGKETSTNKAIRCKKCADVTRRKDKDIDIKTYRRNWHIKKKYGLEVGEFEALWMVCRGKCWICDKSMKMPTFTRGQDLDVVAIDHDHTTGKVRGLVCNACNKGLGMFEDNISRLEKAINYLKNGQKISINTKG